MGLELNRFLNAKTPVESRRKGFVFNAGCLGNLAKLEFLALPFKDSWLSLLFGERVRWCDKVFSCKPFAQSHLNKRERDSVFLCPSVDVLCNTVDGQQVLRSSVAVLRRKICPTAILFAIAFIVVDAVKCCFGIRAWAHIFVEVFKAFPSFAHRDSSTTVVLVGVVSGIVASLKHTVPNLVFRGFGKAVSGLADCGRASITGLKNAFAFCVSKLSTFADGFGAASATTKPPLLSRGAVLFGGFCLANNGPKTKLFASEVDYFAHVITPFSKSNYKSISKSWLENANKF